jgi:hypothetical protein
VQSVQHHHIVTAAATPEQINVQQQRHVQEVQKYQRIIDGDYEFVSMTVFH